MKQRGYTIMGVIYDEEGKVFIIKGGTKNFVEWEGVDGKKA